MKKWEQKACPLGTWTFRAHLRETMTTRARAPPSPPTLPRPARSAGVGGFGSSSF